MKAKAFKLDATRKVDCVGVAGVSQAEIEPAFDVDSDAALVSKVAIKATEREASGHRANFGSGLNAFGTVWHFAPVNELVLSDHLACLYSNAFGGLAAAAVNRNTELFAHDRKNMHLRSRVAAVIAGACAHDF